MWRKAALVGLWVAGMTVLALRFGDGHEERSVETGRLHVAVLPSSDGQDLPKGLQMDVEAEITESGDRIRLVMEAGDVPKANPAGPEIELILDEGDEVYFRVLAERPKLPGGASWVRLDAADAERVMPGIEGVLKLVDADNLLTTAPEPDATEAGQETIDGVETTRYEDVEALDRIDEIIGLSGETFEQMRAATGEEIELTIWQDDEGFVRRFELPVAASYLAPRRGGGDLVVLQYTITDLGEDLTIELPDPADTASL